MKYVEKLTIMLLTILTLLIVLAVGGMFFSLILEVYTGYNFITQTIRPFFISITN